MAKLVICEKSDAARRIALILSNGSSKRSYIEKVPVFNFVKDGEQVSVVGLRGHIVNLDYPFPYNQWTRVNPKDLIFIQPVKKVTAKNIANVLKKLAKEHNEVIVATDYDREGELIGVEALGILKEANLGIKIKRARFSALTKYEIENAFANLTEVDYNLSKSAESRQVIDLTWGAALTRFVSLASNQTGKDFLSVGRVQSPTLALIVDRDREIKSFIPKPYWKIIADLETDKPFQATHAKGSFWNKGEAIKIFEKLKNSKTGIVKKVEITEHFERPPVPFNTTIFLAEATKLGFSAPAAMKLAENLYTAGWISYPRTDNTVYPSTLSLKFILDKLKNSEFGSEATEILDQEEIIPTRGRTISTDHPPIHPVEGATKKNFKKDEWKIYELVVRRFLATLAPDALSERCKVEIDINTEPFLAEGYKILRQGWRKYYPYYKVTECIPPVLVGGQIVNVLAMEMKELKTQPPSRYTQGSLIQEMERLGLGTKSTRHEIIQKLYSRRYVQSPNLIPTKAGIAVTVALEDYAEIITKAEMTAALEEEMTRIAEGMKNLPEVVQESQQILDKILVILEANRQKIGEDIWKALKDQYYMGKCKKCGGDLTIIYSKNGTRFIGCSNYPKCDITHSLPQTGIILATDASCKECGSPMIKTIYKGRTESICIDPKCISSIRLRHIGKCSKCGGNLTILDSKRGKRFIGCSNYPKCKNAYPLPQKGKVLTTDKLCDVCNAPMIKVITKGRKPWDLCINIECLSKKKTGKKK